MKVSFFIILVLAAPILMVPAEPTADTVYTRITEISIKDQRDLLSRSCCCEFITNPLSDCRQLNFEIEYQVWNPTSEDIAVTNSRDGSPVELVYEVNIKEDISVVMTDASSYDSRPEDITPGVHTRTMELSVIMSDDRFNLADGTYKLGMKVRNPMIGQTIYLTTMDIDNGVRHYHFGTDPSWPAEENPHELPVSFLPLLAGLMMAAMVIKRKKFN